MARDPRRPRTSSTLVNSDAIAQSLPAPGPQAVPRGHPHALAAAGPCRLEVPGQPAGRAGPSPSPSETPEQRRRAHPARLRGDQGLLAPGRRAGLRAPRRRGAVAQLERRRRSATLIAYSKGRGVSVWFWIHSKDQRDPPAARELFATPARAGRGRASRSTSSTTRPRRSSTSTRTILRDAAENQLLRELPRRQQAGRRGAHLAQRDDPRGRSGASSTRRTPAWAEHNTTVPFTRLLAGHADYTPVVFGERRKETTWAHQIATAVVFTSPVMVYGAHPADPARPTRPPTSSRASRRSGTRPSSCPRPRSARSRCSRAAAARRWFVGVAERSRGPHPEGAAVVPREGDVPRLAREGRRGGSGHRAPRAAGSAAAGCARGAAACGRWAGGAAGPRPEPCRRGPGRWRLSLSPVPVTRVRLRPDVWASRVETNRKVTR